MIDYINLITDLCKNLEFVLNMPDKDGVRIIRHPVRLEYGHYATSGGFVFDVNIRIEGVRIFTEKCYYQEQEKRESAEEGALIRLLRATFCYGVMASKRELESALKIV